MQTLKIDDEFKTLIPSLTDEELSELELSIQKYGCKQTIETWNGTIIDGHHRYDICQRHGIDFNVSEVPGLESREDVIIWMGQNQLGRCNANAFVRGELALRMKSAYAAKAKARQGSRTDLVDIPENLPGSGDTRDQLADKASMSGKQLDKVARILADGIPELAKQTRSGDLSINMADQIRKLSITTQHNVLGAESPRLALNNLSSELEENDILDMPDETTLHENAVECMRAYTDWINEMCSQTTPTDPDEIQAQLEMLVPMALDHDLAQDAFCARKRAEKELKKVMRNEPDVWLRALKNEAGRV